MIGKDYKLVFEDDFNGDSLDLEKWQYRANGPRRLGFNAPSAVRVENGSLVIRQEYRDGEYGEGWYAGMISLRQRYTRGYFEIRCKCNQTVPGGFWSAFWLQARSPYDSALSRGGIGGAEVDILEAFSKPDIGPGADINIHCAGTGGRETPAGRTDHKNVGFFPLKDCYTAFHTYACEWTEAEYIFYIDDKEVARSTWGDGVSQVDEEVIVSLELPGEFSGPKDSVSEFTVDRVSIWQKA